MPAERSIGRLPLSVVIATRDTRELTLKCLDSVASSVATPAEVILVDDGSPDGTAAAVAQRHPGVQQLRNRDSRGFSAAANRGLRAAGAPLLLLLNSDTELAPDALAALHRAFGEDRRLGVAGAALSNPDGTAQWSGGPRPTAAWLFAAASGLGGLRRRRDAERRPRRVDWVAGAALAMRREVWQRCGPLDDGFSLYCQDLDLCLRAGQAGWRVRLIAESRVMHHLGATIGQRAGSQVDLESLWADLVRWGHKEGDRAQARRVARAIRAGAMLRWLGLSAAAALSRGERKQRMRDRRAAVSRASRAARRALNTAPA